ncbi:hypothetical protein AB6E87_08850 [Vibrio sp. 10N.247.311.64]|uniref:hypothetical protein n=1 Tax=Vibrio sp. 10N.247.311.64 TaxID=3229997 RepID=UPI00354D320D
MFYNGYYVYKVLIYMCVTFQPWKGLKPQDKVVYFHWLLYMGKGRGKSLSIAEIAVALQIKESTIRGSVARLCSSRKCNNVNSNDGRISYTPFSPSSLDVFPSLGEDKLASIRDILGVKQNLSNERAETLSKRLLKAILVSLSDDLGVIERVSFSYLSFITGMTVQRLRRYKNELVDDGFILKFVTGGNAPTLYKKVSSICIIDPKIFGGSRIELKGFRVEKLLSCEPNQQVKIGLQQGKKELGFLVDEINRHKLAGRLHHFFDELVSQSIRDKLIPEYQSRCRKIISVTNLESINNSLRNRWTRDINLFSDFFLSIVRQQIIKGESKGPFDIYFIRTETSCYLLSNIGGTYSGQVKEIDDSVVFKPDSSEKPWVI